MLSVVVVTGLKAGNTPGENKSTLLVAGTMEAKMNSRSYRGMDINVAKGQQRNSFDGFTRIVTGMYPRKKGTALESLLNWDCKIKFRLNRNINIIFSYN